MHAQALPQQVVHVACMQLRSVQAGRSHSWLLAGTMLLHIHADASWDSQTELSPQAGRHHILTLQRNSLPSPWEGTTCSECG